MLEAALLLQPHGFEGLGSVAAESPSNDASILKRHNPDVSRSYLDPVATPHARLVAHDHAIGVLDELRRNNHHSIECVEEGGPESTRCLAPAIDVRLYTQGSRPVNLDIGMGVSSRGVEVALVEPLDCLTHDLHVLLRHRLLR